MSRQDVLIHSTTTDAPPVVAGVMANNRALKDQYGVGIIPHFDTLWAMVQQAGNTARNGGSATWQQDIDFWVSTRAGQGWNGLKFNLLGNVDSGAPNDDGRTFDTKYPFGATAGGTSYGNPSAGLASDYWTRVDYLIDQAAASGLTCFMFLFTAADLSGTNAMSNGSGTVKSLSEFQAFGTALGNRYKTKSNIVWVVGADYFDSEITKVEGCIDALRATGDSHLLTVENWVDLASHHWTTSRKSDTGTTQQLGTDRATLNGSYIYEPTYLSAAAAWAETPTIPNIYLDGYYEQAGDDALTLRRNAGWSLTYGQWGVQYGAEANWAMGSGWRTNISSPSAETGHVVKIRQAISSYPRWPDLVPDLSSTFITAGRSSGDTYVTGSKTADGKLAAIYMPNAASSITVATGQMVGGYSVSWVDPTSGAVVAGTPGTSFSRGTANAGGGADWLLVLKE